MRSRQDGSSVRPEPLDRVFREGRLGLVPTHGWVGRLASSGHREGLAAARERREPEFAGR